MRRTHLLMRRRARIAYLYGAGDPTDELLALAAAGANLAPSTDCINVESDRDKSPRPQSPYLCGHAPGNSDGAVFNTGVIFLTAAAATVAFCGRWANTTLHLPAPQWWSDDQGVFNQILTGRGSWPYVSTNFYPVRSAGLDGKLIHGVRRRPPPKAARPPAAVRARRRAHAARLHAHGPK